MTVKVTVPKKILKNLRQIVAKLPRPVVSGVAVLIFATIGTVILVGSHAATPTASIEPESGTTTGGASVVSDAGASGGQAVKFTTAAAGACPTTKRTITAADVSANLNSGYPAGTQVYVAGGPDPWGGCFPSAANTGIPAGTTLTSYTGPCTITTAGTVIDSKTVNCPGGIDINAANVTIKNSKITTWIINVNSGPLLLTDSEADFGPVSSEGLGGSNFTIRRANMYGGKRQVWCVNTCTVEDSYMHGQAPDPTGVAHESAMRAQENTTYRHNTILCDAPTYPPDGSCSADQTGYPDFAPIHDNTFDKNLYLATISGSYCSYGGNTKGDAYSNDPINGTNIHSTDNVFQRGIYPNDRTYLPLSDKQRYTCAMYGVTGDYNSSRPGFIFSGNMWDDGLLFVNDTNYSQGSFYD